VTFPSTTIAGTDQTVSTTGVIAADDETGSGAGWNITGTSTTFTNVGSKTLPTTATVVTAASAAASAGNCSVPSNSLSYPITLPAGASAPTSVKLYNAAINSGGGPANVTLTFRLTVPSNAFTGSYSSTWTFTIASGP
jgi:hypothetical protein